MVIELSLNGPPHLSCAVSSYYILPVPERETTTTNFSMAKKDVFFSGLQNSDTSYIVGHLPRV